MTLTAPGSFLWLLRHELRLAARFGDKAGAWRGRLPMLLLMLVPAGLGIALAIALRTLPETPTPDGLAVATVLLGTLLMLMVSRALILVLRVFHERADLDLLLSAPLPPERVLAAKAVGVYALVTLPFVVLFGPFLAATAWFGHPRWLGGLPMLVVAAVLATSLSFAIADRLTRLFGKRRTRTIIQVGVGTLAAVVFLLSQSSSIAPKTASRLFSHVSLDLPPPLDWPAQAIFAAPLPLLVMLGLAVASAWGAARLAADNFAQPDVDVAASPAARTGPIRFRSGLMTTLVTKEIKLLLRDPELLSQVMLRLIYIIPIVGLMFGELRDAAAIGGRVAAACTLFAGLLASSLAWLTVCAEDAPELIDAAPVRAAVVQRAKLVAACLPPLAFVLAPIAFVATRSILAAGAALVVSAVAAVTAALLQAWFGKRQSRSSFRSRQRNSIALSIGESVMVAAWSGVAALLARGSPWAIAPLIVAGTIVYASAQSRPARR